MTDYLIDPPLEGVMPISRGADRAFTVQRVDELGDPLDFTPGTVVNMHIDIDPNNPTVVNSQVNGCNASFVLPSEVLDEARNRTKWRVIWHQGEIGTPIVVGRFERHDG